MANITYRSVIAKAIADFNAIQDAIHAHDTSVALSSESLVVTESLSGLISTKLQKLATGTYALAATEISDTVLESGNNKFYKTVDTQKTNDGIKYATSVSIPQATFGANADNPNIIEVKTSGYIHATATVGTVSAITNDKLTLGVIDSSTSLLSTDAGKIVNIDGVDHFYFTGSITATVSTSQVGYFTGTGAAGITDASSILGAVKKAALSIDYPTVEGKKATSFKLTPSHTVTKTTQTMADSTAVSFSDTAGAISNETHEIITINTKANGTASASVTTTDGYYVASSTVNPVVTVDDTVTKDAYIGIRKATWNDAATVSSDGISVGATADGSNGYLVKSTNIKTSAAAKAAGYTTGTTQFNNANVDIGYIAQGKVQATANVTNVSIKIGNGPAGLIGAAPETGKLGEDYFSINADVSISNTYNIKTEGFLRSSDFQTPVANGATSAGTTYIKAATFEFVKDTNATGDNPSDVPHTFIQCKTAGYIEPGILRIVGKDGQLITDFSEANLGTATDIDWAAVSANVYAKLGTKNILKSGAVPTDGKGYTLSIEKSTIDPGYISSSNGSLTLSGDYHVEAGSVSASIESISPALAFNQDSQVEIATKDEGFWVEATPSANAVVKGVVSKEGYVTDEDIGANVTQEEAEVGVAQKLYIKKATYTINENSDVAVTTSSNAASLNGSAKVYANSELSSGYVSVAATGYNKVTINQAGHTLAKDTELNGTSKGATAKIKATNGAAERELTIGNGMATAVNVADGKAVTTYTKGEDSFTKTAGEYSVTTTNATVADAALTDTYVVGNYSAKLATKVTTTELPEDATGEKVDEYVSALYSRLLGYNFTAVDYDNGQNYESVV